MIGPFKFDSPQQTIKISFKCGTKERGTSSAMIRNVLTRLITCSTRILNFPM